MMTDNNYSVYEYHVPYQNFDNDWGNEWGLFVDLENSYSNSNTNNIIISKHDNNTNIITTHDISSSNNTNKKYKYESKNKNKYCLYFISMLSLFICSILNFSILFLMIFIFSWFIYSILFYLFTLLETCVCI